jgi:hypothetical protein
LRRIVAALALSIAQDRKEDKTRNNAPAGCRASQQRYRMGESDERRSLLDKPVVALDIYRCHR